MSISSPKFTVIIPLYNKEKYIKRAINSVLNQTFQEFELIVVDDGSTDKSYEIVKQFNSANVKLVQKENGGESSARNYGILASNGEFLCFLDADDEYLNIHLETFNGMIDLYPKEYFFATNSYDKFPNSEKLKPAFEISKYTRKIDDYFMDCINRSFVSSNTACVKKNVFDDVGMFDERLKYGPDLEMWFRIALKYDLVFCNIPTAIYNRDAENRVMHEMLKFNDLFIDKLFKDLNCTIKCTSEKKYVEAKLIQECKRQLRLGNNKLVRLKIHIYRLVFCNYYNFLKWWLITFLPFQTLSTIRLNVKEKLS